MAGGNKYAAFMEDCGGWYLKERCEDHCNNLARTSRWKIKNIKRDYTGLTLFIELLL